jgi:hypothetical protein
MNFLTKEQLLETCKTCSSHTEMSKKLSCCVSTIGYRADIYGVRDEIDKVLNENKLKLPYVPRPSKYFFTNIFNEDTEASFYLAGFIAADGSVNTLGYSHTLFITLAEKDARHVYKIRDLLQSNHPIKHKSYFSKQAQKYYDSCRYSITSKLLVKSLERFNIVRNKTFTYTIPQWLLEHPLLNHFLRGYIDGDGCFRIHKKDSLKPRAQFKILGTESMMTDLINIFNKHCGFNNNIKEIYPYKNIFRLDYGGNNIINKIIDYVYKDATIYLDRKKEVADQIKLLLTYNCGRGHTGRPEITKEDIFNAAKQCKTQNEIARKLGCSPGNMTYHINKKEIRSEILAILSANKSANLPT